MLFYSIDAYKISDKAGFKISGTLDDNNKVDKWFKAVE